MVKNAVLMPPKLGPVDKIPGYAPLYVHLIAVLHFSSFRFTVAAVL